MSGLKGFPVHGSVRNCSAKPWAGPPAGLPSMATEQPTKCPPSTSMGTVQRAEMRPMMSQRHARFARRVTGLRGWPSLSVVLSWGGPAAALGSSKHDPDSTGFDRCGEDADRPLFHGLAEQLRPFTSTKGPRQPIRNGGPNGGPSNVRNTHKSFVKRYLYHFQRQSAGINQ